ncbi:MAG: DUF4012 domain-containing protein [Candidatus Uhrbacteria bacterium]
MDHNNDFLEQIAPSAEPTKPHRRRWLVGLGIFFAAVGMVVLWTAVNAGLLVTSLLDGKDQLEEAKISIEAFAFEPAKEPLKKAGEDFSSAYYHLRMIGWLKITPWLGPQISAAEEVLKTSNDIFKIVDQIADLGSDVISLISENKQAAGEGILPLHYDDLSPETKRIFLQRLNGSAPDLALAAEKTGLITQALSDLGEVPEPMGEVVKKLNNLLSQAHQILSLASTAVRITPAFTGLEKESTFLLLLENNAEMRPAGGFIGSYGVLKIESGEIKELVIKDSYLLDLAADPFYSAEPPTVLKQYLAANKWYFRDSNWSPDFPSASRQAIAMFTNEVLSLPPDLQASIQEPLSFDGVIAFTPTFVSDLLKITGSINIGDQIFTAENVLDTLEYQVEQAFAENGLPYDQRKDIITTLLNEMKAKIFDLSLAEWGPVITAFEKNLVDKQLVLFSNSSTEAESVIANANWGGIINPGDKDFLMVVDANLASLKTDPQVERTISYSVNRDVDGKYIGQVDITYNHTGNFDWKTTRYRTYTRVYVPSGSQLINSSGLSTGEVITEQDLGATVFGGFISIEPSQTGTLSFTYILPEKIQKLIATNNYFLKVDKQIGAMAHALTLDLDFGKKVAGATPAENSTDWGDNIYRLETKLYTDKTFSIWF